jgi:glycine betaine/proline transport system permease protein
MSSKTRSIIYAGLVLVLLGLMIGAWIHQGISLKPGLEKGQLRVFEDGPKVPLGEWITAGIDAISWVKDTTRGMARKVNIGVRGIKSFLMFFPPFVVALLLAALGWALTHRFTFCGFTILGMLLLWGMGVWEASMETLALVSVATLIAVAVGIPLGIVAALSSVLNHIIMPILDFMQTLPPFVYLIPAVPFFMLGETAALFATVVFAMPPAIRLTALGIQQVPKELVEAVDAFGSTRLQKLTKLQLPIAAPSIRAGVNQTLLLALSMAVIAALVGARGLGGEVWKALQQGQVGLGFEAGLGIVVLAIVLDRLISAGQGKKKTAKGA